MGVPPRLLLDGGVEEGGGDEEFPKKKAVLDEAAKGDRGTAGDFDEPACALERRFKPVSSSMANLDSGRKLRNTSRMLMSSFAEQSTTFTLKNTRGSVRRLLLEVLQCYLISHKYVFPSILSRNRR